MVVFCSIVRELRSWKLIQSWWWAIPISSKRMSSSRTPASALSRKDSDKIYLEILRLEKERALIRAKQAEEAAAKRREYENDVGRKFFNKVMAKRKARLAAEQGESGSGADGESGADKPLLFSSLIASMASHNNNEKITSSILPSTGCQSSSSSSPPNSSGNNNESSSGNRRNLEISLQIEPDRLISSRIPCITDRMQAIPPEPITTPTIVCPKGFKGFKFVNTFTLKFTPAECCGGPRNIEVHAQDQDKCLCFGRIESETEVFLQRQNENDDKEMEELLAMKYDSVTKEWTVSFPELETVAYMVRPKPASRVSAAQVYEIFSAEGSSNYFNLGVEMEKSGSSRQPDFVFRILNSNLATVGTVILLSNWKAASVTIDDSLWPSQKAVILAVALYMSWDVVQDIRRKAAWVRVLIASGVILSILMAILLVNIYLFRRED